MKGYSVFKRYQDPAMAREVALLLREHGIACELEDNSPQVDVTMVGGQDFQKELLLSVKEEQFELAQQLLDKEAENAINQVGSDHYLYSFSNEELSEILLKPEEWNSFDVKLAQKILAEKGITVSNEKLEEIKKERNEQLAEPDSLSVWATIVGYITAFTGGIPGIFYGWYLVSFVKTLPNGKKVYGYDAKSRSNGKIILVLGIVMAIVEWYLLGLDYML